MNHKQRYINLICSIVVFVCNICINFWLSPFIVENIGVEANGFVTLANNFVSYANLIVIALNSMASRFILVEYVKKDYKKANIYYNSVFVGNLIIVAACLGPAVYILLRLDYLLDVPVHLVQDVKWLFFFVFVNFFLGTGLPNWNVGTFVANRLDKEYKLNVFLNILKCSVILLIYSLFEPRVYIIGITSTLVTVISLCCYFRYTREFTPELRIEKGTCSFLAMKTLVSSGIWNSISNVGNMLLTGLDLVICNIFIDSTSMGVLALSKTLTNQIMSLSSSITSVFVPELTSEYALGNTERMRSSMVHSMNLTLAIITVPYAGFVCLGKEFFSLWVPSQNAQELYVLALLGSLSLLFCSGTQTVYNIFTTFNKVKTSAIVLFFSGVLSTIIVFVLLNTTKFGIYAIAAVSSIIGIIRNVFVMTPLAAKYLKLKWYAFYPQVVKSVFSISIITLLGMGIKSFFCQGTWTILVVQALIIGIIGLGINMTVVLDKEEKKIIMDKIRKRGK